MVQRVIKPKTVTKPVEPIPPRPHLVDLSGAPSQKTFAKADAVLAKLPGGFQRFVVAKPDGTFVPVAMLMPTEYGPDNILGCQRFGCHVMVGLASGVEAYADGDARKKP